MIWIAYALTKNEEFLKTAKIQSILFKERLETDFALRHHDIGFLYSLSAVADCKLTGDHTARETAIGAAYALTRMYQKVPGILRRGGDINNSDDEMTGVFIIDCMNNVPLLFWTYEQTGGEFLYEVAYNHVKNTLSSIIRPDGRVIQHGIAYIHTGEIKCDSSAAAIPKCFGISTGNAMNIMTLYSVKISYNMPAPTGITAQKLSDISAGINWSASGFPCNYAVYKSTSVNSAYSAVYFGNENKLSSAALSLGTYNYYRVSAVYGDCVTDLSDYVGILCDKNKIHCQSGYVSENGGEYTVKCEYISTNSNSMDTCWYVAVYSGEKLCYIYNEEKTFLSNEKYGFIKSFTLGKEFICDDEISVRAYLFDKNTVLKPLAEYINYK